MRKIIALAVLFILILFWWRRHISEPMRVVEPKLSPVHEVTKQKVAQSLKTKRIYQGPRAPLPVKTTREISPACQDLWDKIRQTDLAEFQFPPKLILPPAGDCTDVPGSLGERHRAYLEKCSGLTTAESDMTKAQWSVKAQDCEAALFFYRAAITDYLTWDQKAGEISDPRILVDKLMNRLRKDPNSAADMAERLLEVEPKMTEAAQGAVLARLSATAIAPGNVDNGNRWQKFDETLRRVKETDNVDPRFLYEAQLLGELQRPSASDGRQEKLERLSEDHPDWGAGPYYQAWDLLNSGNPAAAQEKLREALRREPNNPQYQQTLSEMQAGKERPFHSSLSFSISDAYRN